MDIQDAVFSGVFQNTETMMQLGMIFAFVIAVSLGGAFLKGAAKRKRRANRKAKKGGDNSAWGDLRDPANQMQFVAKVGFKTQPLLNKEELPLFNAIEGYVRSIDENLRFMAQTSLGEVLKPDPSTASKEDCQMAFRSINSKRLDFAVFDRSGQLIVAIEYQGTGHYRKTSFMRDAVKREALRKAGVTMIEVPAKYRLEDVQRQLQALLGAPD